MEFVFDVRAVLPGEVTRSVAGRLPGGVHDVDGKGECEQKLATIVNKLGTASAKAQGLRSAITTYQKLRASSHTLYLLRGQGDHPPVLGILRVGRKKLFLSDVVGVQIEARPLCVLDFYIHESQQRNGHGRKLFEAMLRTEGVGVTELAIDRPSNKFLSFLKKHYKLESYVEQGNHFVVFPQFFPDTCTSAITLNSSQRQRRLSDHTHSPSDNVDKIPSSLPTARLTESHSLPHKSFETRRPANQHTPDSFHTPPNTKLPKFNNYSSSEPRHQHPPNAQLNFSGPLTPQISKLQNTSNLNVYRSPDNNTLSSSSHDQHTHHRSNSQVNCRFNIITGAPLLGRECKSLQGLQGRELNVRGHREVNRRDSEVNNGREGEREKMAPLLTLRDRDRSKRGGFWSNGRSSSSHHPVSLQGYRLANQPPAPGRNPGSSNAYSHHRTSIPPFCRAPIPDNN